MDVPEVAGLWSHGYHPMQFYHENADLKAAIDRIASGYFTAGDTTLFAPLIDHLLHHDEYMLLADYQSYIDCQDRVSEAYRDQDEWTAKSILNVARMSKFSSDRSIQEYCDNIWHVKPVEVDLNSV